MKQLMAGSGVALIGITLVPLLSGLFGQSEARLFAGAGIPASWSDEFKFDSVLPRHTSGPELA